MSTDSFYVARKRTEGVESDYLIEWVHTSFEQPEDWIRCKAINRVTLGLGGISVYSDPEVNKGHLSKCAHLMIRNMNSIIEHVEDMTSGKNHSYKILDIQKTGEGDALQWDATWEDKPTESDQLELPLPFEVSLEDFKGYPQVVDFNYLQLPLEVLTCFNGQFESSFFLESEIGHLMELLALAKRNLIRIASRMDAFGKMGGYITNDVIDAPERFSDESWYTADMESDIGEDKAA